MSYDPVVHPEQAAKLCELGATDEEIAQFFEISARTLYRWRALHAEFCQALKNGKAPADDRVERSLYEKANGYRYVEQQAIKVKVAQHEEKVEIVEVERAMPPDTTAIIFWLKNRRKDLWRDVQRVAATDTDGNDVKLDEASAHARLVAIFAQAQKRDAADLA